MKTTELYDESSRYVYPVRRDVLLTGSLFSYLGGKRVDQIPHNLVNPSHRSLLLVHRVHHCLYCCCSS